MPEHTDPMRVDASILVASAPGAVADRLLLTDTAAPTVLSVIESGMLTLEDAWARVPHAAPGPGAGRQTLPRIIAWAMHPGLGGAGAGWHAQPDDDTWLRLLSREPGAPAVSMSPRDRVMAWAFSDPRAWTGGPIEQANYKSWASAMDWAVEQGDLWPLEAGLRQPDRPGVPRQWFETSLARAVVAGHDKAVGRLVRFGRVDVGGLRAREVALENQAGARGELARDGQPLLHLACRTAMVRALLEAGADPHVRDGEGVRADEGWRAGKARQDSMELAGMLDAMARHARPDLEEGRDIIARRDADAFSSRLEQRFRDWLDRQPRDLVVGPGKALPGQALWGDDPGQEEKAKRAGMLLRHLDAKALARVGTDGVSEADSLWWAVAMGHSERCWKAVKRRVPAYAGPGAWVGALDALPALMARPGVPSTAQPWILGRVALFMAQRVCAQVLGQGPEPEAFFPAEAGPAPEGGWAGAGTALVDTLVGWTGRAAGGQAGALITMDMAPALAQVARHARAFPTGHDGQPRQDLLEALLGLWAGQPGTPVAQAESWEAVEAALDDKRWPNDATCNSLAWMGGAIGALVRGGAVPSAAVVDALGRSGGPLAGAMGARMAQVGLEARVGGRTGMRAGKARL